MSSLLEYIYMEKPWQNKSYYQACHQEVTKRLSMLASTKDPWWWLNIYPLVPLLQKSSIWTNIRNILRSLTTYFALSVRREWKTFIWLYISWHGTSLNNLVLNRTNTVFQNGRIYKDILQHWINFPTLWFLKKGTRLSTLKVL